MLAKTINYPRSFKDFYTFIKSNIKYETLYYKIGIPQPFDVSLRDGLQALTKDQQTLYDIEKKKQIYYDIYYNYRPQNIEIGTIGSNKLFPVFSDTLELLKHIDNHQNILKSDYDYLYPNTTNNYILIPNSKKLLDPQILNNVLIQNYSFITSVSNSFQYTNTKMNLKEVDEDILNMMYILDDKLTNIPFQVKLYVSCINECPIEGKIDLDFIVKRLLELNKFKIDNLCLSDTCGTLELEDFKYIVNKCIENGIPKRKLSLHLHVRKDRENIIEQIIHYALDCGIVEFDVSVLETGGCSVTMKKKQLAPNLSYELYYKSLVTYFINNA
jgi:hypothetical protein